MSIFKNFLIAQDQALNTLIRINGEWGLPDETLSARAWRLREAAPQYRRWIDRLFFWNYEQDHSFEKGFYRIGHCELCHESEMRRKHLPQEYRSVA
ncbi:hypothetical protein AGMMS50256_29220 [Betaproteobacteria bacterium]|nr:hypothetical protein AGMMS50256_29220 [Betaproteobacteria bacterium]